MAIYRDFDRAALDAVYDNRAQVPNFPDILARWSAAAATAARISEARLDIAYGQDDRQSPDLLVPAEALSPIRHIPARAKPLMLCVGGDELPELQRQQAEFSAAWAARGLEVREIPSPDTDHFTVIDSLSEPDSPLYQAICSQILPGTVPS